MNRIRIGIIISLALTACASPGTSQTPTPSTDTTQTAAPTATATATATADDHAEGTLTVIPLAIADGPGIDIPDVIAGAPANETLVNGWLLVGTDGVVWLCESLTDASPPGCAGDRLQVEGFPSPLADDAHEADGVSWYPHQIQVLGNVSVP